MVGGKSKPPSQPSPPLSPCLQLYILSCPWSHYPPTIDCSHPWNTPTLLHSSMALVLSPSVFQMSPRFSVPRCWRIGMAVDKGRCLKLQSWERGIVVIGGLGEVEGRCKLRRRWFRLGTRSRILRRLQAIVSIFKSELNPERRKQVISGLSAPLSMNVRIMLVNVTLNQC